MRVRSRSERYAARTGSPRRAALLIGTIAAAAGAVWWFAPPDPVAVLRRHGPPLERVEREPAPSLGAGIERWRLIAANGDTATALWRPAPPAVARPWTVVLLGGLVTGERAALLVPSGTTVNALAVDWPWLGSRRLTPWQIAGQLGAMQRAVLASPGVLALGAEAAARQPEVDSSRIALVGVSLGVPPVVAALRLTRRPRALVLIDGAADLRAQFERGFERERIPRWLAAPLAAIAFRLARPLEPAMNAGAAAGLPALVINSEGDEMMPRATIERLHAALPGAEIRWRAGEHIRTGRPGSIAGLATEVDDWLRAREDARRPPAR